MLQNMFSGRLQYNQQARRFFMTIVALGFVIDGVYAVLLNLYLLRLGYDPRFIGQVNSLGLLAFAMVSFPAGVLGARWASTHMMRVGVAIMLMGTLLLPFGESVPAAWRGGWFIVTYAMTLMGFSSYFVNSAPFLMTVVEHRRHNNAFAIQTALISLAAFGGSLLGGNLPVLIAAISPLTLEDPEPYRYTFMLVALAVLVAFVITLTLVEQSDETGTDHQTETRPDKPTDTPVNSAPAFSIRQLAMPIIIIIGIMSLVRFLQLAGVATSVVYVNVYMDTVFGIDSSVIGTVASLGRLLAVPIVLLAPRLISRSSTGSVALWASLITVVCLLPIAFSSHWWGAALGYIGVLGLSNLRFTAFIIYILMLVPKKQQSIMAGAGETAAGFSFALMAWGGGYVATTYSFRELFLLGAILSGLGTFIFWVYLCQASMRKATEVGALP